MPGGIKITGLDKSQYFIDDEPNTDALLNLFKETLGIDTALSATITDAIMSALKQLPELLSQLGEGPSDNAASAWAGVFDTITSGA